MHLNINVCLMPHAIRRQMTPEGPSHLLWEPIFFIMAMVVGNLLYILPGSSEQAPVEPLRYQTIKTIKQPIMWEVKSTRKSRRSVLVRWLAESREQSVAKVMAALWNGKAEAHFQQSREAGHLCCVLDAPVLALLESF